MKRRDLCLKVNDKKRCLPKSHYVQCPNHLPTAPQRASVWAEFGIKCQKLAVFVKHGEVEMKERSSRVVQSQPLKWGAGK